MVADGREDHQVRIGVMKCTQLYAYVGIEISKGAHRKLRSSQ